MSGALGPQGYEQTVAKYRLSYADSARQKFLSDDWVLDNYSFDSVSKKWKEKTGDRYRAERHLDEDGDGTIAPSEKKKENVFDLRFVNSRDNAVIWLKVHPLSPTYASVDLDVILDDYANGLEGTGLFEQSTLFGLVQDKQRHFTTFVVKKEPTALGELPAIRGVIEIADVEKLRLDAAHRDSKAELVFAKVTYLERLGIYKPTSPRWPIVVEENKDNTTHIYSARRTGLLVIGYYNDASRFESHLADLHALQGQIVIPDSAVPPNSAPLVLPSPPAPATVATKLAAPAASERPTSTASASSADPASPSAPSASPTPATSATSTTSTTSTTPNAVPAPTSPTASPRPATK